MKKVILILALILVVFSMAACDWDTSCKKDYSCNSNELCVIEEGHEKGECVVQTCKTKCSPSDNPCSVEQCDQETNFECERVFAAGSVKGCSGYADDDRCIKNMCSQGACVQVEVPGCLDEADRDALVAANGGEKEFCDDGSELGECSKTKPGFWCYYGVLVQDPGCLPGGEYYEGDDEPVAAKSAQKVPLNCDDGTIHNECSMETIGLLCNDGVLEDDASCLPVAEPEPETVIPEVEPVPEEEPVVIPEPEPEVEVDQEEHVFDQPDCGDTPDGACSPDGRWCIEGALIEDYACEHQCADGTPDWGCSQNQVGFICQAGELVEDLPSCDPNYVYVQIDCDDGTEDGFCNAAETHWCNQGVLEELGPDMGC